MDLDELLFGRVVKYLKRRKERQDEQLGVKVVLQEISPRLTLFARILSGRPVEIYPAQEEGGYKDDNYFLPAEVYLFPNFEENLSFYFYRIAYLSVQQNLNLNLPRKYHDDSLIHSRLKALESAPQVLETVQLELPVIYELYLKLLEAYRAKMVSEKGAVDMTWFYGKWMKNSSADRINNPLGTGNDQTRLKNNLDPSTTIKAKGVEEIKSLQIDAKKQEDDVLNHSFEKVETAEEFSGVWRDFDGDDQLEDHQEALDEINMSFTVRVDDPAHSVYQADFIENTTVAESSDFVADNQFVFYPEWNYKKKIHRKDFCKVYPKYLTQTDLPYYFKTLADNRSTLMGLRKKLTSINNKWQEQRRQSDGDHLDIDATIDFYSDVHAKRTPSDRIYLSKRKLNKDISVLLLLDASMSSDSYVVGNRVLDVEKEVTILFSEILEEFGIDFSVATFHSQTRNYSSYDIVKDFSCDWSAAKYRIGAIQPNGYTRIGAALRHAATEIRPRESKSKWIILLSDGKPNDYDRYEGRYGVEDVKKALSELYQENINAYALAIEAQARYYLPQMFGQNHYKILQSSEELLETLVHLFEKIKYQSS